MRNYNIFFTSDTHFSHANAINFLNYDGSRMRPFDTWKEADEKMIENWNKVVKPTDKVYFLGDLAFNKNEADKIMPRLNGKKCLIKGNHDLFKPQWYLLWFYDIRAAHNFENFLMTHVPVHPDSKARFKMNIHGHTHCNKIFLPNKHGQLTKIEDPWYRNVCMDSNNYTPVAYEDIQHEYSVLVQKGLLETPKERNKKCVE